MQFTVEDISAVEKRVDFEVPWRDVAPKLERAYDKLRRQVRLKGFRPGRVPRTLLEKLYHHDVEHDVARELVELSLGQAIQENQIQPVAPPTVDKMEIKSGEPFRFSARVEVRSQVAPKDYAGIEIERRPAKVTDEQVAEALEGYRRQLTQFKAREGGGASAPDDVLLVEIHGRIGAQKVKKSTVALDLEDDAAGGVPGLAERLGGVPLDGAAHEIKYRIPADAPSRALAGEEVSLHVTVKEARERRRPALDDELAKDTGEADTLDELRRKIRQRLLDADQGRIRREMEVELVKEILKRNPVPVAPALVDRHAEAMIARAKAQLVMAGITFEDAALDDDKLKAEFHGEAEEEARAAVVLQAIAEREGVEVTDADVQKRVAELAAARQENVKKLRTDLEKSGRLAGLRAQILEEKTLELLVGRAKITDADPDRRIITPKEARGERLVVTPDEARAEAEAQHMGEKAPRK